VDKLLNALKEEQAVIKDGLIVTPPKTLEDLHERVGRHRGLETAIQEILASLRGDEEDE
jgi:hypothetical protein